MPRTLPQPGGASPTWRKAATAGRALNRCAPRAVSVETDFESYEWTGEDEFSGLDDRQAEPPLPLPPLAAPRRIVLVRHGQSTWNAEGRIQGSTDFATLSLKGQDQAQTTSKMVRTPAYTTSCHRARHGGQRRACFVPVRAPAQTACKVHCRSLSSDTYTPHSPTCLYRNPKHASARM